MKTFFCIYGRKKRDQEILNIYHYLAKGSFGRKCNNNNELVVITVIKNEGYKLGWKAFDLIRVPLLIESPGWLNFGIILWNTGTMSNISKIPGLPQQHA